MKTTQLVLARRCAICWTQALLFGVLLTTQMHAASLTFETLQVGSKTYTNVTVVERTQSHVFLRHDRGLSHVRIAELDEASAVLLGLKAAPNVNEPTSAASSPPAKASTQSIETSAPPVATIPGRTPAQERILIWLIVGAAVLVQLVTHLFYSYCARRICFQSELAPGRLIWVPWFQRVPLLRAANMNIGWILADPIPFLGFIGRCLWALKMSDVLRLGRLSTYGFAMRGGYLFPTLLFLAYVIYQNTGNALVWGAIILPGYNFLAIACVAFFGQMPQPARAQS